MWIFFIAVILALLILVFIFAESTQARTGSERRRPARTNVSATLPAKPKNRALGEASYFTPAAPPAAQHALFVPIPGERETEGAFRLSEAEIRSVFNLPPVFEGQKSFNWDALCRVTGQNHRLCSCEYCQTLKSRDGLS